MNPELEKKYQSHPAHVRPKIAFLRELILDVASHCEGVGELEETLKWGEPAFLTPETKSGTTIRIDWKDKKPDQYSMYFNCRTTLIDSFKSLFPQAFQYEGNRAIVFGLNDVVAVANERVLFTHEQAFEQPEALYGAIRNQMPDAGIVIVPTDKVSLEDAIKSYLFNAQLVTLPDAAGMALILPTEARENEAVWNYLTELVSGNGPIRRLCPVDVRQSMANGGGPACLRLRVVADPGTVDQRFMATPQTLDQIEKVVAEYWPEAIHPDQLSTPDLNAMIGKARARLLEICGLSELAG